MKNHGSYLPESYFRPAPTAQDREIQDAQDCVTDAEVAARVFPTLYGLEIYHDGGSNPFVDLMKDDEIVAQIHYYAPGECRLDFRGLELYSSLDFGLVQMVRLVADNLDVA